MTSKQRRKYLKHKGVRCPYCGSEDIVGESVEIDGGTATQEVDCSACQREWQDVYALVDVQPL
jgi:transcription elongation factor Elf1